MAAIQLRIPLGPPVPRTLAWLAIASVAVPLPFFWARPIDLYVAMIAAALLALGFAIAHRVRSRPRGWVIADGRAVSRSSPRKREDVAKFSEPFGVTVLASQARKRAILALTTPTETRFLGVRLEGPSATLLVEHASFVADGDALAAHASDDESMSSEDAVALVSHIRALAPLAQRRLYLSGTRGERIVLDGHELRVDSLEKTRLFDLESPVEWRGFLFHEALGPAASIYQATWIRQGSAELVLVAPMPTELLLAAKRSPESGARRASREAQILAPTPDEPPPGDLRTGIERVFMLPVREALARAPRPSRNAPKRHASSPDLGV